MMAMFYHQQEPQQPPPPLPNADAVIQIWLNPSLDEDKVEGVRIHDLYFEKYDESSADLFKRVHKTLKDIKHSLHVTSKKKLPYTIELITEENRREWRRQPDITIKKFCLHYQNILEINRW